MITMLDRPWFTGAGDQIEVDLLGEIREICSVRPVEKRTISVGTDGQRRKKRPGVDFVTVVAIHDKGKGGRGFWARMRERRRFTLQEKLYQETWNSIEVALALMKVVPRDSLHEIEIHVDANPHPRWQSSRYHKQLAGMVTGQGFKAVLKPDAWVASHMADHMVKNKYVGR